MVVKVKKLHKDAIMPKYQTPGSAGFDVHALVKKNYKDSYNYGLKHNAGFNGEDILVSQPGDNCEDIVVVVLPQDQFIVRTGLSFVVPDGYEMQIRPRSGLAVKHKITITNSPGTLDSSYRGELMVILFNLRREAFIIHHGDRIAQCVINKIEQVKLKEVEEFSEEDMKKDRGGGLGSTGIK